MQLELVELVEVEALVVVVVGTILVLVLVFQRLVLVFQGLVLVFQGLVLVQEELVERVVLVVDSLELGLVEGKSELVVVP
jgi:sulfite exporter TauE/SafE